MTWFLGKEGGLGGCEMNGFERETRSAEMKR